MGDYGEIFERNVGAGSPLKIDRGINALWTEKGAAIRSAHPLIIVLMRAAAASAARGCTLPGSGGGTMTIATTQDAPSPASSFLMIRRVRKLAVQDRPIAIVVIFLIYAA